MQLGAFIDPIVSPSLDWIAFLTLSDVSCSQIDLIQLSRLPNLGVLTIGPNVRTDNTGLDDGVIRGWARSAATSNAFSVLRVLSCRSQRGITSRVFSHLAQFPALAILNSENCKLTSQDKPEALRHGWNHRTGNTLGDFLIKGGAKGFDWDSVVNASFHLGTFSETETLKLDSVASVTGLPRLHLCLGFALQAVVIGNGHRALQSFYRLNLAIETSRPFSNKRSVSQSESINTGARKTPAVRVSKQQSMENLLLGLGG